MKDTAVKFLIDEISCRFVISEELRIAMYKAIEMEKYNSIIQAKKYYLKGFEDAELTQNQGCSHEQTMRDAESFFELVYPIKSE
jgi:hypothetical protein